MLSKGDSVLTTSISFNLKWSHRDLQICLLLLWLKPFLLPQSWVVTRQVLSDGSSAMKFYFMISEASTESVQEPPWSCFWVCLGSPGRAEQGRAALHTTCVWRHWTSQLNSVSLPSASLTLFLWAQAYGVYFHAVPFPTITVQNKLQCQWPGFLLKCKKQSLTNSVKQFKSSLIPSL